MCLISSLSGEFQVMSSGDITVVPSTTPTSDTLIPPSTNRDFTINEQDTLPQADTATKVNSGSKANSVSASSEFDPQEQPSNSSLTESIDIIGRNIREVTSLDAGSFEDDIGEMLKRDNARSAFEIMSFIPADQDDLDKSGTRRPVSTDSLGLNTVQEKGESGSSEDSMTLPPSGGPHPLSDSQKDSSSPPTHSKADFVERSTPPVSEQSESITDVVQGTSASSPKTMPTISDETASKSSSHVAGGVAAGPVNGSSVQPNRFRRVNQYARGRWTVRDSLVTEEHAEGLPSQHALSESLNLQQSALHSTIATTATTTTTTATTTTRHQDCNNSDSSTSGTPPLKPAHQRSDPGVASTSTETTPSQYYSDLGEVRGGGLAPIDGVSEKDSSSIHMDRSSTAAETLSRNTSLSSMVALEKSVDGDELLRDIDTDSMTGNQNSTTHEQEMNDAMPLVSPQPPVVPTSSAGAVPPPSSTSVSRDEQLSTPGSASVDDDRRNASEDLKRVEHAMSFLQNELKHVLTSSSYPTLIEENRVLKFQQTQIDQTNVKLKADLASTRDDLQATREENIRLKRELKELRSNLTQLLTITPESSSLEEGGTSSGPSLLSAGSGQSDEAPSSSNETCTTNNSQDLNT